MTHPSYLREHTRRLRAEKRLTIDELAERLALSRSTIYYWVRDMPIPGSGPGGGFSSQGQRKGTRAMKRKYRLLREAAYREGVESYEKLAEDPTFRDFVCLYIGEGSKRSRGRVALGNSDPLVVLHATCWIGGSRIVSPSSGSSTTQIRIRTISPASGAISSKRRSGRFVSSGSPTATS